jgi:hypothetical protein
MFCSFHSFNVRPENWDLPSRSSKVSIRTTELNAGRKYQFPAGIFNTTWLREIFNLRSEHAILVVKVFTFRAGKWDLPCRTWLSSTLVETHIFRPENGMLPACEKLSTSGGGIQTLLEKIQLSGRIIEINLADSGSCLLEWHISIMVETTISRQEYFLLSAQKKLSSSGRRMIQFYWSNFHLPARGFTDCQLLVGGCSSSVKSSNFPIGSVALTSTQPLKIWLLCTNAESRSA